ncbi:hypothetical protein FEM48_ZijujUnG0007100 [Ziziphus jujuba var. spinosa]|uniref:Uncharacterized protein n=1 Tax=Ziziphus jujuba var. spinosa TaxID=714518 RepID=A0A978UA08_ZIZJJ|nr:hypothetical protein FEM48_ZijujUnG0007100 [Ziziphus jujuba var. spinosa]
MVIWESKRIWLDRNKIWPLDVQVDNYGKVITILVATFCKDRVSSSSYTQYSLLTMQYKSGVIEEPIHERVLEKKAPIQVIIPKASVEDEDFLFSMRLCIGGKPSSSAVILFGDGMATVSHYYRNSTSLYQFNLPYDAGKVLDASILPSTDDGEEGPWVVLTEKAGIWPIPEKAVIIGGFEPPERSLSGKGSSNEGSAQEERKNLLAISLLEGLALKHLMPEADKRLHYLLDLMRVTPRDANHTGPGSRFCILRPELITAFCQKAKATERSKTKSTSQGDAHIASNSPNVDGEIQGIVMMCASLYTSSSIVLHFNIILCPWSNH